MEVLQGVLGSLRPAVVAMIASAGITILITAFWGNRDLIALAGTKLESGSDFCSLYDITSESENESNIG